MRDDAVLGRALPLDRGLGPNSQKKITWQILEYEQKLETFRGFIYVLIFHVYKLFTA